MKAAITQLVKAETGNYETYHVVLDPASNGGQPATGGSSCAEMTPDVDSGQDAVNDTLSSPNTVYTASSACYTQTLSGPNDTEKETETTCVYPGSSAFRISETDSADGFQSDSLDVLAPKGVVRVQSNVGQTGSGDQGYQFSARSSVTPCDPSNSGATLPTPSATGISGVWATDSYTIDGNGVPARAGTGSLDCTASGCTGTVAIPNLDFDTTAAHWVGNTANGNSVIATVSPDAHVLTLVVCPDNTQVGAIVTSCTIVAGTK
ncbi:MAG TPA: hypothetical protein VFQ88_12120 [Nevskiaceae bacterium]|nr:hypothetical protein [Nevskiaceae bacterium]